MASRADNIASQMSLANFSKATELRQRIWFTIGALIVFRFLSFVPLPGVNPLILENSKADQETPGWSGKRAANESPIRKMALRKRRSGTIGCGVCSSHATKPTAARPARGRS